MENHPYSAGFTLVEIIVVVSMLVALSSLGLFVSFDTYRGNDFRKDRDLLVSLLQHARAQAIANVCSGACTDGVPHGVHIGGGSYSVFQGSTYSAADPLNQGFTESPSVTPSGGTDVIFTQLEGRVGATKTITLTGGGKTSTITIDPSGRIWWTN